MAQICIGVRDAVSTSSATKRSRSPKAAQSTLGQAVRSGLRILARFERFPPRARGCTLVEPGEEAISGGSPARAGMHRRRV